MPIARPELALEVGGPEIVGRTRWSEARRRGDACERRRRRFLTKPWRASRSPAVLIAGHATAGWRGVEPLQQFLRSPVGMLRRAFSSSCATASVILCGQ